MSKPSRRPNREHRPKKKRDRELKRQIEAIPIMVGFFDDEGNEVEFSLDCDRCWARLGGECEGGARALPNCGFCADEDPIRCGPVTR